MNESSEDVVTLKLLEHHMGSHVHRAAIRCDEAETTMTVLLVVPVDVVHRLSQVGAQDGLQETLADVRRALDTVDDGTWGFCDVCGQPIAAERLEVRPRSTLCLKDPAAR